MNNLIFLCNKGSMPFLACKGNIGWGEIIQAILFFVVFWYTRLTRKIATEAEKQRIIAQQQTNIARSQFENIVQQNERTLKIEQARRQVIFRSNVFFNEGETKFIRVNVTNISDLTAVDINIFYGKTPGNDFYYLTPIHFLKSFDSFDQIIDDKSTVLKTDDVVDMIGKYSGLMPKSNVASALKYKSNDCIIFVYKNIAGDIFLTHHEYDRINRVGTVFSYEGELNNRESREYFFPKF